jgi:tRNA A22 N-methylase
VSGGGVMKIVGRIMQRLEQISDANIDAEYEFMLSPNLNTFELRQFLQQYPLDLLAEEFVAENGQCHEHLHLRYCRIGGPLTNISASNFPASNISAVGERIWSPLTEEKVRYLKKMILHYQQCVTLGGDLHAQVAVDAYSRILA